MKLNYEIRNKGCNRSIIFIHGNSQSCKIWQNQLNDALFNKFRLVAFDLPGHGKSEKSNNPIVDYSLAGTAKILKDTIDSLALKEYIVCAFSLGTNIVGEIANKLTGCRGFFLVGPSVIGKHITLADIMKPFEFSAVLFMERSSDGDLNGFIDGMFHTPVGSLKQLLKYDYENTDPEFRANLREAIKQRMWSDELKNLEESGKPVAILFGQEDKFLNIDYLDNVSLRRWEGRTFVIPAAGHMLSFDQLNRFNELLSEFAFDCLNNVVTKGKSN